MVLVSRFRVLLVYYTFEKIWLLVIVIAAIIENRLLPRFLHIICGFSIILLLKMVSLMSSYPNFKPGLLPTPTSPPIKDFKPEAYVGASFLPVPFQVVSLLEGCPIDNVISWDLSVSTKSLKLKIEWSSRHTTTDGCIFSEIFPNHILKTLSLYNIGNPTWTTTSSPNKLVLRLDWQISKPTAFPISSGSSPKHAPTPFQTPLKTPNHRNLAKTPDSGFFSGSSIRGASSSNWRQDIKPLSQPNFSSPRSKPTIPDDRSSQSKSTALSKSTVSNINPEISTENMVFSTQNSSRNYSRDFININCSRNRSKMSQHSFAYPRRKIVNHDVFVPRPKSPILIQPSSSKSESNYHDISVSVPTEMAISPTSPSLIKHSNTPVSNDSQAINSPSPVTTNSHAPEISNNKVNITDVSFESDVDMANNILLRSPSPLPIDSDGFIDPDIDAHFMNISGSCRLCNVNVSSHLVDCHLLECSNANQNLIDNFLDDVTSSFSLDSEDIMNAAKDFASFKLVDSDYNKYFNDIQSYFSFVRSSF